MRTSIVNAKCKTCRYRFEIPLLSDFAYGEFVYSSQDGRSYKYLNGIGNKTWDFIQTFVIESNSLTNEIDYGFLIQKLMGLIADKDNNTLFYQNERFICPNCVEDAEILERDVITGFIDLNQMTFNRFNHLTDDEKKSEVNQLMV